MPPVGQLVVPRRRSDAGWAALAVLAGGTLLRLVAAAGLPLFDDEAYYWTWSRRLAAGYFDHPPAIAFLIRTGTLLLGDSTLGVRLFPILAGTAACLAGLALAGRLAGREAARDTAVVASVMPLTAAGLVLATPDAPLIAAVAWMLYAVVRAITAPAGSGTLRWWLASGALLGLSLQAKYTAVLLPAAVGLAMVLHPSLRRRLLEPGPWLGLSVAALLFAPVVIWNAAHQWVSFAFQLRWGLGRRPGALADVLSRVGEYVGGQAALVSPMLFVLMAVVAGRALARRGDPVRFLLAVAAAVPFLFFACSATRTPVEANWPALAYLPASVLLVTARPGGTASRAYRWGVGLAAAMSAVLYLHAASPVLPLRADRDPIARAFGWDAVTSSVLAAAPAPPCATAGATTWFAGNRYQDASQLAFQLARREASRCTRTFSLNVHSRPNQYDLWPGLERSLSPGDHLALLLSGRPGDSVVVQAVAQGFGAVRAGGPLPLSRGGAVHDRRRLWILEQWRASGETSVPTHPSDPASNR